MPGQPVVLPFARGDRVFATVPAVVSAIFPASPDWAGPACRVQVWSASTCNYVEIDIADMAQLSPVSVAGSAS